MLGPIGRTPRFSFASSRGATALVAFATLSANPWWVMARMQEVDEDELNRRWGERRYLDAMKETTDFEPFPKRGTNAQISDRPGPTA